MFGIWATGRCPMKRRVLVVDDEIHVAETLAIALTEHGYHVKAEYSGEAGVQQANSFQPDLVILDVVMPGMNGIAAAIRMQEQLPNCRILLLSALPEYARELLAKHKNAPKFEVIGKPIDPWFSVGHAQVETSRR